MQAVGALHCTAASPALSLDSHLSRPPPNRASVHRQLTSGPFTSRVLTTNLRLDSTGKRKSNNNNSNNIIIRTTVSRAAAGTTAMTTLAFEPVHALCGGAILGIATVAKLAITGRILGVSGSFKRPVESHELQPGDVAFVGGLIAAGLAHGLTSASPLPAEPMVSVARAVVSGALVGCGAAMGNGCTSGHGICGNARFSPRSMAYTVVFMTVGFAAATLGDTNAALGVRPVSAIARMTLPSAEALTSWGIFAAVAAAAFSALAFVAKYGAKMGAKSGAKMDAGVSSVGGVSTSNKTKPEFSSRQKTIANLTEALVGFVFGTGLVISGGAGVRCQPRSTT